MDRKRRQAVVGSAVVAVIILIAIAVMAVRYFTPSKERMQLTEYYPVAEEEILIFMENEQYKNNGLMVDGTIYLDIATIQEYINHRFYWDNYENMLVYTTPTEIIKAQVGESSYSVNKSKSKTTYPIVKTDGENVFVALEFVALYSNVEYEVYEAPNRVVLTCNWGTEHLYGEAAKDTVIRFEPSIKSPILADVEQGEVVIFSGEMEEIKGFVKVMTKDGVIGYVKNKFLKETYYETLENDYVYPEYTSISKNTTINLVWHQIFSQAGNNDLMTFLDNTKGINVISPTWFSIKSEDGEITSLASERYVERAHKQGIDVWALVDDFSTEVDKEKLFGRTSSREKLANELIAAAIRYNLDGINIDFEKITQATSKGYIQFLRELSVKCRNNGIILSVDNYIPAPYNMFYNRTEQGVIADYVICMAYDEHYAGSEESGSVASISYVETGLANTLKEVPAEKIVVALPFYTRLWKEVKDGDSVKVTSEAYSMPKAATLMMNKGVELLWDEEIGQYYGEYQEDGATYKMWLEDDRSYELKLKTVFSEKVAGVAAWKLGLENSSVWNVINKYTK